MSDTTRISIMYGGTEYAVTGRSLEDVLAEVESGTAGSTPTWLAVTTGQGRSTEAKLLLGGGIPVAVWVVNADGQPSPGELATEQGGTPAV